MIFIDFEVFRLNWLCVAYDTSNQQKHIIVDDIESLRALYESNKDNIFVGYNIRGYDAPMMKCILQGHDPYKLSQHIISGQKWWEFNSSLHRVPLNIYDCSVFTKSLKELEGNLGLSIKESTVSFDLERELTAEEIEEVVDYCVWDVESTIEVFLQNKKEFDSQMALLKTFNLPLKFIGKTKAQLSAIILGAEMKEHNDEFDYFHRLPDTIILKKPEYQDVYLWYQHNQDYETKLDVEVSGIQHTFGFGGLHAGKEKYCEEGIFLNLDVGSYYPALIIEYDYMSRNVKNKGKYKDIRDERLRLKAKKDPKQEPYKIVLNSKYGCLKAQFNPLYDPLQANCICVAGQLMLLDLIEKLEGYWELLQSNTDGLMGKVQRMDDVETIKNICAEWEKRNRMTLEFEIFKKVFQKDVNNYLVMKEDGSHKSKGAWVKKLSTLDYNQAIVNKAIVNYLTKGIDVRTTIINCDDLIEFQGIEKITGKYAAIYHGDERLSERCIRTFSSKDENDKGISKLHKETNTREKISGSHDHVFIDNGSMVGVKTPSKLDKSWYIDLAINRIREFGLNYN